MTTFAEYAEYYDLLYQDKDYSAESQYVSTLIDRFCPSMSSLLDVGCGTGRHAVAFCREGVTVAGLDCSEEMLATGKVKYPQIALHHGRAESFQLPSRFDVITSLFHVISYQTGNDALMAMVRNIYCHLNDGGIFIFDFWYGPAVLTEKPSVRIKRVQDEKHELTRISEPDVDYNANTVKVHFDLLIKNRQTQVTREVRETHLMRYFFLPELELVLQAVGFKVFFAGEWMNGCPLSEKSWNGIIVAGK